MQYPELFSNIYQLRIRVLLEISFKDRQDKQNAMSRIFERGKVLYERDPASFREEVLIDIAKEEIQDRISIPTGMSPEKLTEGMSREEIRTTVLYYQENKNIQEIAEELHISEKEAEGRIAGVKKKISDKLDAVTAMAGITSEGFLIGLLKTYPVPKAAPVIPPAAVTPGIPKPVPRAVTAGGKVLPPTPSASTASSVAAESAAGSAGKAVESSVVYSASNAGPVSGIVSSTPVTNLAAGTAAKAAVTAGGMTATKAIVTAAVTVTVLGGGGYAGYKYYEDKTKEPEQAPEAVKDPETEEQIDTPVPTEVVVEETEELEQSVIWVKEPLIEGIKLYDLGGNQDASWGYFYEMSGYPSGWPDIAVSRDAVFILDNSNIKVIDFEGNSISLAERPAGNVDDYILENFYINGYGNDKRYVFNARNGNYVLYNNDLTVDTESQLTGGYGYEGYLLAVRNNEILLFNIYEGFQGEGTVLTTNEIKAYTKQGRILCSTINDSGSETGIALIDSNGIVMTSNYYYGYDSFFRWFSNHFCFVSEVKESPELRIEDQGPYAALDVNTGEPVTGFVYNNFKFFEDGYCPVKKDGYWGFINEQSEEVTDFIFEDVSTLCEGRAFVKVNGKYGILDLKTTLEKGIPVTFDTVGGSAEYPEPEKTEDEDPYVGQYYEPIGGRIHVNVEKKDGIYYITGGGSGGASISYTYTFSGVFDENGRMDYTNCVLVSTEYPENGDKIEKTEYTGGSGYLIINGDNMIWHIDPYSGSQTFYEFDTELIRYKEE